MRILTLDLGKNKSVFCDYQSADAAHAFGKLDTTPAAVHDLLVERAPDRVVLEVGPAAGWVVDLCRTLGVADVQVANVSHDAWRWRNVRAKTDRLDALKLAQLSAMNQLPTVHVPRADVRQWRSLIEFRRTLVDRRTAVKNHVHALFDAQGMRIPGGKAGWTRKAVALLRKEARALADCPSDQLWRGQLDLELTHLDAVDAQLRTVEDRLDAVAAADPRVDLLRSAPGVGPRLAEAVVAVVDDPKRFTDAKAIAAYLGLAPKALRSGACDRTGRISRQGNATLRALLVEVAWIGQRYNPWMRETYQRVRRGVPKRSKAAIVATARRLLVRLWAMLRDNARWRNPAPPAATTAAAAPLRKTA
jgi:transposase